MESDHNLIPNIEEYPSSYECYGNPNIQMCWVKTYPNEVG